MVPNSFQSALPLSVNILIPVDIDMIVNNGSRCALSASTRRERDHLPVKLDAMLIDDTGCHYIYSNLMCLSELSEAQSL